MVHALNENEIISTQGEIISNEGWNANSNNKGVNQGKGENDNTHTDI